MKEARNICSLWKKSVQWDRMTTRQKALSVWFSLSFTTLWLCGESLLLASLAVANFGCSVYFLVKCVPMEDE